MGVMSSACEFNLIAGKGVRKRRRLPPVPLQTVALEPEQQVGSAVAATGLPRERPCSNAADRPRPRGDNLGSKGIRVGIEHRRRRQLLCTELRVRGPVAGTRRAPSRRDR